MMDIAAQLAKDFGMKECWINVYAGYYGKVWYSNEWRTREYATIQSLIKPLIKPLYRIHVRMK